MANTSKHIQCREIRWQNLMFDSYSYNDPLIDVLVNLKTCRSSASTPQRFSTRNLPIDPPKEMPQWRTCGMEPGSASWFCVCVSLRKCSNLLLPCRVLLNFAQWLGWSLLKASHCQPLGVRELLWQSTHKDTKRHAPCGETTRWSCTLSIHL